jgi:hypothetical protein
LRSDSRNVCVHVATAGFRAELDGEVYVVEAGERVVASHPLVRRFPDRFREFGLAEELHVRSERVRELADRDFSARRPQLTEAGRAEQRERRFWDSTTELLEATGDYRASSEDPALQAVCDAGLEQADRVDQARVHAEQDEMNEMWRGELER